MRGKAKQQQQIFSYIQLEERIPATHPLRGLRKLADTSLLEMDSIFSRLYSAHGRPSIPPEQLLKASLLQILYGIRSEIQLMEQMDYNLLYRWFVGLSADSKVWTPEVFSVNRERLFNSEVMSRFLSTVVEQARIRDLISEEHFSVDGTLLKAWASQRSFRPKQEGDTDDDGTNFHDQKRSNKTHRSTTDPEARLYRKGPGKESMLSFMGHTLMENRNGLLIDAEVTLADGFGERQAAEQMLKRKKKKGRVTLGADKGYDVNDFARILRDMNVTPHLAQRKDDRKQRAVDDRTTRHPGYGVSQQIRKRIEQGFGWIKSAACIRQVKHRGRKRIDGMFKLTVAAYNLLRINNLCPVVP